MAARFLPHPMSRSIWYPGKAGDAISQYEWQIWRQEALDMVAFWWSVRPPVVKFLLLLFLASPGLCLVCRHLFLSCCRHCRRRLPSGPAVDLLAEDPGWQVRTDAAKLFTCRRLTACCLGTCFWFISAPILAVVASCIQVVVMDPWFDSMPRINGTTVIQVFEDRELNYSCVKIPSTLALQSGTLLAFAEARMATCSDFAWTDLIMKRSEDVGKTWSNLTVVRRVGRPTSRVAVGNAVPVQIHRTGRILLPHLINNSEVWMMHSDDDGVTWSEATPVAGATKPEWRWVGLGPPASLELRSGRILVPAYHGTFRSNSGNLFTYLHTLFSDDEGASWKIGADRGTGTVGVAQENEGQLAELANGSVMVISRAGGSILDLSSHFVARSDDGGRSFTAPWEVPVMRQPLSGCEGSLLRQTSGRLLFASPSPLGVQRLYRKRLTLFGSQDEGTTWKERLVLHDGMAGYSSMVNLRNGAVGIFFEHGSNKAELVLRPEGISFMILPLETLDEFTATKTAMVSGASRIVFGDASAIIFLLIGFLVGCIH